MSKKKKNRKISLSDWIAIISLVAAIFSIYIAVKYSQKSAKHEAELKRNEIINEVPELNYSWLSNYRYIVSGLNKHSDLGAAIDSLKSTLRIMNLSNSTLTDVSVEVLYSFDHDLVVYPYDNKAKVNTIFRKQYATFKENESVSFDLISLISERYSVYSFFPVQDSYYQNSVSAFSNKAISQGDNHYFKQFHLKENAAPFVNMDNFNVRAVYFKILVKYGLKHKGYRHILSGALGFCKPIKEADSGMYLDGFTKMIYSSISINDEAEFFKVKQGVYNGKELFANYEQKERFEIFNLIATDEDGFSSVPQSMRVNIAG